jgi:hypothetical protein
METNNFKNFIEKFEYIGENLYLLFQYNHNKLINIDNIGYKEILLINFLKELLNCEDSAIINSLNKIILKECKKRYYDEYRKFKHYPNEEVLRNNIKSIDTKFDEFMLFIKNNNLKSNDLI